jgi:signal transduction histidine kinase
MGMRISLKVFLVGAFPIAIAAAIAVAALLFLDAAERARTGAQLAGDIYRNLLVAMSARDDYVHAQPGQREVHAERFTQYSDEARQGLKALAEVVRDPVHGAATAAAREALDRYVESMKQFMTITAQNDALTADMAARAASLIALTDQARQRQHDSNADIVDSLNEGSRKLRVARDIVEEAQELRAAVAATELEHALALLAAALGGDAERIEGQDRLALALTRLRNAAADLTDVLTAADQADVAAELKALLDPYVAGFAASGTTPASPHGPHSPGRALADWVERLVKVNASEQRSLFDLVAQLLGYSVEAAETEQATQNVAIEVLKLSSRAGDALAGRDPEATAAIVAESRTLGETVARLPISPLIQSEMIDALDQWSRGLSDTTTGLERQNGMIADMDAAAVTMVAGARSLNDLLADNAERIGETIRTILIVGAAIGLLVGAATAAVVARSITRPLRGLQQRMVDLANNPQLGPVPEANRRDELGEMARATDFFVTEIVRREQALRRAKDRADSALAELQETQASLIQAEKLASLGQLVAGVAHEINTPLGIALTTSTLLDGEVKRFAEAAAQRQLQRSVLERFVERMTEGSRLLFANLTRAANLVHSFKQVAADQASGERRRFGMAEWLNDLLTSLGPVLRKGGHTVTVECRPDLAIDSYPGALAQVLTNLIVNAVTHAYGEGQAGHMAILVSEPRPDLVRLAFSDDGRGIPPENLGKVFDPFFTTGRSTGSTGLGLHIVYNLVTNRLQGRIDLDSRPGAGTRFVIELPKRVADALPEPERGRALGQMESAAE